MGLKSWLFRYYIASNTISVITYGKDEQQHNSNRKYDTQEKDAAGLYVVIGNLVVQKASA